MKLPLPAAKRVKKMGMWFFAGSAAVALSAGLAVTAYAQQAPATVAPSGPPPARQAIETRKAVFVLIAGNFKPIGEVLQGKAPYNATEVQKRATRVAFLADLVGETFPEVSNTGLPDTKAKAEIWSDRADFDKRVNVFREHAATLAQVAAKETTASDAFKAAAAAVAQDCKSCHEAYKVK